MNEVKYDARFIMPPEVATNILCEPTAKISNRLRKDCNRARASAIVSLAPISADRTYRPDKSIHPEVKLLRRFRGLSLEKLARIPIRCDRKRRALQNLYRKTTDASFKHAIDARVDRLEIIRDAAVNALNARALFSAEPIFADQTYNGRIIVSVAS